MAALVFVAALVCAAVYDVLTIRWYDARDRAAASWRAWLSGIAIAAALEVLRWVPVMLAIDTGSDAVIVASVLGSVLGNAIGLPRPVRLPRARARRRPRG
jgi:hypothetical protein